MKIYDISQKYDSKMINYPSLNRFEQKFLRHYETGYDMCLSQLILPMHVGTHLDAPYHFIKGGQKINEFDMQLFYGSCQVMEIEEKVIDISALRKKVIKYERILFKTGNSKLMENNEFNEGYSYIGRSGAEYLVKQGVKLVGIDYFSVDASQDKEKIAHKILLGAGVVLLEAINLSAVDEGEYTISCFPLNIEGSEASPCRAVLIK